MKQFLKYTFATIVGMVLFFIITGIIGTICLIGLVAADSSAKDVKDNSVMVLNLSGALEERSDDNFVDQFGGNKVSTTGLDDILAAIKKAKDNDNIKGIYIKAGMLSSDSYASLQAIRDQLVDFKENGKWIISYGDIYTQGTYYVCSVADKIFLNPSGQIDWHGLSAQPYFLKDLLAKFGVKMQLAKVGTYKSMPEMYTAEKMSDANREQVTVYVKGIWENICEAVSNSRKISVTTLNTYADSLITFNDPKDYVKYKLADKLIYTNEIKAEINKLLKVKEDKDISTLSVSDMQSVKGAKKKGEEIAVYYAYGEIVDSEEAGLFSKGNNIVTKPVCKDLKELMEDDDVKAVVIRVNSGGGSAYASEQIWHYIQLLKEKKPVVVSMGGMAASGGYYISSGANWIVAEPTTLTGSIGIFGMFPDVSELLTQKLGVKFDEVNTNKNSSFGTLSRPFNDEELAYLNKYIERGYNLFLSRVAEGRKMSTSDVDKVAQGRVWLGQDAVNKKLVDELGGLDVAVKKAASLAKVKEYHTTSYPEKADWFNQLLDQFSDDSYADKKMQETFGEFYAPFKLLRTLNMQNVAQARLPFVINVK
ncbi:MAG: signal peptide peptidase SppA [Prevotella sp.]|nr:signal peptide peptidase SppA [Prevotella sp.]